jgi:UDP-N-acetylglucosamine transferase subunit ALG13
VRPALVLVVVGTDHHPFDRLVRWVDRWAGERGDAVRAVVQHGSCAPPVHAEGHALLAHADLVALMDEAAVVVSHGGPGTIADARRCGRKPVVVPRDPAHGEHVDDHQVLFSQRLAHQGTVLRATTEDGLRALLDGALADPATVAVEEQLEGSTTEPVRRFAEVVAPYLQRGGAARAPRPRVLYLGGFGRSGSTLVERVLGQVPGVTALGEVVHLWARGALADERCGCGEPFSACEVWRRVGKSAYGGWDAVDASAVEALRASVDRLRLVPRLLAPGTSPSFRRRVDSLVRVLDRFYAAAQEVSGASVLVDSSKHASYAFVLRHVAVDLRVVHVVRDSRGVAHSWSKRVLKPEAVGEEAYMPTYSAAESSLWWALNNVLFDVLARVGVPVLRLRYEDLLHDPRGSVRRIVEFAGLDPEDEALAHLGDRSVELVTDHTVAGNPMRFTTGRLELRVDEAWRAALPPRHRRTVTALTAPLLLRYGYLAPRRRGRGGPA